MIVSALAEDGCEPGLLLDDGAGATGAVAGLVWDSNYLQRLRARPRRSRRADPAGVWFWTKPRVRVYSLFVTAVLIAGIAVSLLELAGTVADAAWLRGVLVSGLLLALVTLMVRIGSDIVGATRL